MSKPDQIELSHPDQMRQFCINLKFQRFFSQYLEIKFRTQNFSQTLHVLMVLSNFSR